jgi:hypothetical protein
LQLQTIKNNELSLEENRPAYNKKKCFCPRFKYALNVAKSQYYLSLFIISDARSLRKLKNKMEHRSKKHLRLRKNKRWLKPTKIRASEAGN